MPTNLSIETPATRTRRSLVALISLSLTLLAGCASLAETPPKNYSLTGVWELNQALSDTPSLAGLQRKARAGGRRQQPSGQAGGPGAQRQGGGQGRPNGQNRPQAGGSGRSRRGGGGGRLPALIASSLTIDQSHESMGMTFDGKDYRDVSWGTRKRGATTVEAGWQERDLLLRTTGGPMKIEERYVLSADGQRLTVYIELDGGRDDLSFKRVFDKASDAANRRG